MSWSVSAQGKVEDVAAETTRQFQSPLSYLTDEGEKETVRRVGFVVAQCLTTFDPEVKVSVSAFGHMGGTKEAGGYQNVSLTISPLA